MRNGLFLGALLATMMIGGTALAERNDSDSKTSRGRAIKEQVLEKQKEGFGKSAKASAASKSSKAEKAPKEIKQRSKGEIYGDQGTRGGSQSKASSASGRNMSASNRVNTPSEIRAMIKMIAPMHGAYRVSQASEGTDAYGGADPATSRNGKFRGTDGKQKNLSATGAVNNPSEIKAFLKMLNPMLGAYNTCQAAEGTDAYSNTEMSYTNLMSSGNRATRSVHFKNDKGEVTGSAKGDIDTAKKSRAVRERMANQYKERVTKTAPKETDVASKNVSPKGQ